MRKRLRRTRSTGTSDSGKRESVWHGWSYSQGLTVDVQSELLQGRAAAEHICGWVSQHGADLTVLASHGEHGRGEWALSSTARTLVDAVPGSLLLVPADGDRPEGGAVQYRRIMVPLDGSDRAESVLPTTS